MAPTPTHIPFPGAAPRLRTCGLGTAPHYGKQKYSLAVLSTQALEQPGGMQPLSQLW